MDKENQKNIHRRGFLKSAGGRTVAVSASLTGAALTFPLTGCGSGNSESVPQFTPGPGEEMLKMPIPTDQMTYRTHPRSGDRVSLLGYGCMRFPTKTKVKSATAPYEIDQEAVNELVDYAIAHGVNFFDTSPRYLRGHSERTIGQALSRYPRDKFFISTKLSNQAFYGYDEAVQMYQNSFRDLQVDYFDYYLAHAVGTFDAFQKRYVQNGVLKFMMNERKAGRIRHLGWSFHGQKEFFDYMLSPELKIDGESPNWDFVLIQANYFDWNTATGRTNVNASYLYDKLEKLGIPVMIMEPLLGGQLAKPNFKALALMKQAEPEASCASWAFRFISSFPNVLTVLSGMTYMEHLQDNLRTFCPLKPLSDTEREVLRQVTDTMSEFQGINCTQCQYCMPCPYGIDIPEVFAHYNRCLNEGNFPSDPTSENYKKARRAFLIGYDRRVPKLRQANHCISCSLCEKECPQFIKIGNEMKKIDNFVENLKLERGKAGL